MSHLMVTPTTTDADGCVETFEVYSAKLGEVVRVSLHAGDKRLLSDRGLVMISPPSNDVAAAGKRS